MTHKIATTRDNRFTLRVTALFGLALLLTAIIPGSSARAFAVDGPEAVIEITKHDVGEVFAGEEIEYTFFLRNAGTKDLELKEKSTISFRNGGSGYAPSNALWRAQERSLAYAAAAMRAAPS